MRDTRRSKRERLLAQLTHLQRALLVLIGKTARESVDVGLGPRIAKQLFRRRGNDEALQILKRVLSTIDAPKTQREVLP
jgi:hypothetical protein